MGPDLYVGGDLSSKKLAYAVLDGAYEHLYSLDLTPGVEGTEESYRLTRDHLSELQLQDRRKVAAIEHPIVGRGTAATIKQAFVNGAVQAALWSLGFEVYLVYPVSWKAVVVGHGHSSKEEVAGWVEETNPAYWTEALDAEGTLTKAFDLFDARACAEYARLIALGLVPSVQPVRRG